MTQKADTLTCRAVLFDMDGVLIDSTANAFRHWAWWAEKQHVSYEAIIAGAHGRRSIDTIRTIAPHLNAQKEERELTRRSIEDLAGVTAMPGVQELLAAIPSGSWTIVTSAGDALARARLAAAGVPAPAKMITAELVEQGKPDPQGYLLGSALLDTPPEQCVVIEDAPAGIAAAKNAGMQVIAVASTHTPANLAGADIVIPALAGIQVLPPAEPEHPILLTFRHSKV